jgi:hydrogenase small subunit
MPGFPDKFMPFMDEPPGGALSTNLVRPYGRLVKWLRGFTQDTLNKEPKWRHNRSELTTNPPPEIRR